MAIKKLWLSVWIYLKGYAECKYEAGCNNSDGRKLLSGVVATISFTVAHLWTWKGFCNQKKDITTDTVVAVRKCLSDEKRRNQIELNIRAACMISTGEPRMEGYAA